MTMICWCGHRKGVHASGRCESCSKKGINYNGCHYFNGRSPGEPINFEPRVKDLGRTTAIIHIDSKEIPKLPRKKWEQYLIAKTKYSIAQENQEQIEKKILKLYNFKIKWKYQCPPERRGAVMGLLNILGMDWEKANQFTLIARSQNEFEKLFKNLALKKNQV